jgi:dihydrofolate reductase
VRAYLRAGLVDDPHVVIAPVLLGSGERLFDLVDGLVDRYEVVELTPSAAVTHVRLAPTGR